MYQTSSFEAQAKELLNVVEQKIQEIERDNEKRLIPWKQKKIAIEETLNFYSEVRGERAEKATEILSTGDIAGKSQKEILLLLARRNNGVLLARKAIVIMKKLGVFGNPDNAGSAVYSILRRAKEFDRVGQGVYKLRNSLAHNSDVVVTDKLGPGTIVEPKRPEVKRVRVLSRVRQAVKELRDNNPNITKQEILMKLSNIGFDFKGKKPSSAINMSWSYLEHEERKARQEGVNTQAKLLSVS